MLGVFDIDLVPALVVVRVRVVSVGVDAGWVRWLEGW